MFAHDYLIREPLFYLFIAFSFLLGLGYFWGRRVNNRLFLSAFNDLITVIRPVDQTFTNIGGLIGHHGEFIPAKRSPVEKVEATITFLPRQALLYLPVSMVIRKYDRLFITIYLRHKPGAEGHLIETGYSRFRGPKITNADRLKCEEVSWGGLRYYLYFETEDIRKQLVSFMQQNLDPGTIRHIAVVPKEKKCFVFMIPRRGSVARFFGPVYTWISKFKGSDLHS
jgi:hypothetical protein